MKIMKETQLLIFLTLFCILTLSCQPQSETLLIKEIPISDLSKYPIYPRLIEEKEEKLVLKKEYKYIDSIDIKAISYLSDGLKINGFVVKPKREGKYPCIIYNRGGNRTFGQLLIAHAAMSLGRLANEGYVVIASQYREGGHSEGKDEFGGKDVNDVLNLIEVLHEIKGADTEKIGMYGWSRGGMMTYLALTRTNQIDVAIVGGAVSDNFESIKDRPEMETHVLSELIPSYNENREEELIKRSAIYWADRFPKNVPILMLHGNSDWRVKATQSLRMAMEFDKYRVPYKLIIYEGGDHGINEHKEKVNTQIINWLNRYLKGDKTLPNMEYHGR